MRRAAATGVVDFSRARLLDRKWWMRLNWMLNEVEISECQKLLAMKINQNACALDYQSGKQAFEHHWKIATQLYEQSLELSMPWLGGRKKKSTVEDLRKQWVRIWGDPSDPKVKAKIDNMTQHATEQTKGRR